MTTETPTAEPAAPPATTTAPGSGSLLANLRVIGHPSSAPVSDPTEPATPPEEDPKPEPSTEPAPQPEPKPETPPSEPKPEPKPEPTAGMSPKASERFNRLEKEKKHAEEERDTVRKELEAQKAQYEELRKQAAELEGLRRDAAKAIEEAKTYREQLRAASIERDPEFQQQYSGEVMTRQQQMLDMAVAAGATREAFIEAINSGDEDALEGFRESLPPARQRIWDAKRIEIEDLWSKRQQAVKDSEKTWAQLEESRKHKAASEAERMRLENVEVAKSVVRDIRSQIPSMDKEASAELDQIEEWLSHAVTDAPREELIGSLASGAVAHRIVKAQKEEIERLSGEIESRDKQLEELKEKLGEQETFIKNVSSQVPRPRTPGNPPSTEENGSLISRVRVRMPGQ
jgi:hypothetical protein